MILNLKLYMAEKVEEFYEAFGQSKEFKRRGLSIERAELRYKLYLEEFKELVEAISCGDKVEILDAIIDMLYVRIGTLLELDYNDFSMLKNDGDIEFCNRIFIKYFGLNDQLLEDAFDEVHRSNMSKLGEDGKPIFGEDGKILKGENYFRPDLKSILKKHGYDK